MFYLGRVKNAAHKISGGREKAGKIIGFSKFFIFT